MEKVLGLCGREILSPCWSTHYGSFRTALAVNRVILPRFPHTTQIHTYVCMHICTPRERKGMESGKNMDFVCSSEGKTSNNRAVVKISSLAVPSLVHTAQLQFPENYFIILESAQKSS